jgi:hypothetical protein
MKFVATKDFKTVNQKFRAGDEVPDTIDFDKWKEFVTVEGGYEPPASE